MNRLRAFSACIKHSVLGLGVLVGLSLYGSGLAPLPDSATMEYPFNTVCEVKFGDATSASGVLVADNIVMTAAEVFASAIQQNAVASRYSVQVRSVDSASTVSHSVSQVYATDSNTDSVLLLVLSEPVNEEQVAVVNVNTLSIEDYRLIVGYASDMYTSGGSNVNKLHATSSGEAVDSSFGRVNGNLYHTGDLKASLKAIGAPVFSHYDGIWSLDGVVVENEMVEGSCKVVAVDSNLADRILSIAGDTGGNLADADSVSDVEDATGSADSAIELELGYGRLFSIAPQGDVDYHKFSITRSGNYVIESFGSIDVSGTLLNDSKQLITSDDDSGGSVNYRLDVALDVGTYYVKTTPYSGNLSGQYGLSLLEANSNTNFADAGYLSSSLIPLDVENNGTDYSLESSGDIDTFRLSVSSAGHLVLQSEAGFDLKTSIFKGVSGAIAPFDTSEIVTVLDKNDDFPGRGSDSVLDVFLPAGEYLVAVEARNSGEFGPYRISTSFYPNSLGITDTSDDSGSFATALEWTPGTTVEGKFDEPGDRDSYQFDLSSNSQLLINISSSTDVVWFLYDADLNQIDSSGAAIVDPVIEKTLSSGTYYLVLAAMSESTYTLK